jgi:hypothetical protein
VGDLEAMRLACLLCPESDELLLIFADALAESGDDDNAVQEAMIRAQFDPTSEHDRVNCEACRDGGIAGYPSCRKRGRIATLLTLGRDFQPPSFRESLREPFDNTTKGGIWHIGTGPIDRTWRPRSGDSHQHWARCERGMIREIRCSSSMWKYWGETICARQPIDRVTIWDIRPIEYWTQVIANGHEYTVWDWRAADWELFLSGRFTTSGFNESDLFNQPDRCYWNPGGFFRTIEQAEDWMSILLIGWARWQGVNRSLFADDPWRGVRMAWDGIASERFIPSYGTTPADLFSSAKSKL